MIEQFARFLAEIIRKKDTGKFEEATAEIQTASKRFIGLGYEIILGLPDDTLIDLLSLGSELDVYKCHAAAELLKTDAEICEKQADTMGAAIRYQKSLYLLLQCFERLDRDTKMQSEKSIDYLLEKTSDHDLPSALKYKLIKYYEVVGRYSRAEDLLFDLVNSDEPGIIDYGIAFYGRLLSKSDEELKDGNLPRREVEESLRELKANPKT